MVVQVVTTITTQKTVLISYKIKVFAHKENFSMKMVNDGQTKSGLDFSRNELAKSLLLSLLSLSSSHVSRWGGASYCIVCVLRCLEHAAHNKRDHRTRARLGQSNLLPMSYYDGSAICFVAVSLYMQRVGKRGR